MISRRRDVIGAIVAVALGGCGRSTVVGPSGGRRNGSDETATRTPRPPTFDPGKPVATGSVDLVVGAGLPPVGGVSIATTIERFDPEASEATERLHHAVVETERPCTPADDGGCSYSIDAIEFEGQDTGAEPTARIVEEYESVIGDQGWYRITIGTGSERRRLEFRAHASLTTIQTGVLNSTISEIDELYPVQLVYDAEELGSAVPPGCRDRHRCVTDELDGVGAKWEPTPTLPEPGSQGVG